MSYLVLRPPCPYRLYMDVEPCAQMSAACTNGTMREFFLSVKTRGGCIGLMDPQLI